MPNVPPNFLTPWIRFPPTNFTWTISRVSSRCIRSRKFFHVELEKLIAWLERGRRGHRDTARKQWLRRLLDTDNWGPPTAEEEARAARGRQSHA
jgi:hypothetical protein